MSELRLVGLHDDGEQILLEGPDGQRFTLPIDEPLRAAVRRDRPQLELLRARASSPIPPREMQARMRAGATAQEVADLAGVAVELVTRYEGPVRAERDWVAEQARDTRIGHDTGAPTLGDLVTDRLATRGVAPGTVAWDAFRDATGPWSVQVSFEVGDVTRSARWTFDVSARTVRAMDDEARWLSETDLADEPIPRRHLAAVPTNEVDLSAALRPVLAAVDLPVAAQYEAEPEPDPYELTEALLNDLNDRRGVRQPLDEDEDDLDDEEFEGFGPQHAFDFDHPGLTAPPAAHPPASRPEDAVDATVLELPGPGRGADRGLEDEGDPDAEDEPDEGGSAQTPRPRGRKGRASVPSWDEIVFGAKPE